MLGRRKILKQKTKNEMATNRENEGKRQQIEKIER